ncbi:unnamed protein product, partial [Pleuronectes platessa]
NPRVNVELRHRLPSPARRHPPLSDRHNQDQDLNQDQDQDQDLNQDQCPQASPLHRSSVSPLSSRPSGGSGEMERDMSPSRGPSPHVESCRDAHGGDGVQRGPGSPVLRRHVDRDDSFHHDVVIGRVQSFDRDKNISFLLKELDTVRRTNHRLQAELLQKDKELERRRFEEELRKEERERPAVVLEEVWTAQKDRDQAMMSRLLLANEERDEALLLASRLLQAAELEKINLDDTNMEVDELLQCVCDADSAQEVEEFGSVLVQRLRLAQQRRDDITAQEMKAVMEERDGSVAKFKRLEQDLIRERERRTTKDELLRRQTERGGALDDRRRLEAELQALRANHSSSPLLFRDDSQVSSPEAPPLSAQMQQLSKEKQSVEAELQRCQGAEREASERVLRLERLVEVLRKKVGTGSVRAVI